METLRTYLEGIERLSPEEWQELEQLSEVADVKATHTFLRSDQRSFNEIFILKGVVRAYIIDEEGNEKTTAFYMGGNFLSTNTLRTLRGLSIYNYQALPDTKLLTFSARELSSFFSRTSVLSLLGLKIKEMEKDRLAKRDVMLLQVSAVEKYKKFQEHYPELEAVVSHKYIASYLGMTPVSFSRIRKKVGSI